MLSISLEDDAAADGRAANATFLALGVTIS